MMGLVVAAIFITGSFCVPAEISANIGIQRVLESEQHYIEADTIIVGNTHTMHAVCYVYKRNDIYLFKDKGELAYGLSYPEAHDRFLQVPELNALLAQRGTHRVVVALHSLPGDEFRKKLPEPDYQRQWLNIWFVVYEPEAPK